MISNWPNKNIDLPYTIFQTISREGDILRTSLRLIIIYTNMTRLPLCYLCECRGPIRIP